ncbi:MAG: tRNA (adenosine(37)-N6)-threonylcarbamoyltransferase complex ATPase subunit type 1 TsaE [Candidatus Doudnabacteria bacterium CG10_big_fil_rev_8_21_14_0_10_41_10]|uniref:tRNA threonylcarbamoyladenosine biosynthesis protein TsaE n=1 Tax=Candidatus Doudnabacteria bacterium CG10_big_fil_rev_8_21_14_0_10_41_10 TaxID=1974551 RepID=A0A2H0VED8_9BACT|nr:MAG: tRNA (adenosine(37)-N6)-threonylcarbamoyltransferase complex ATPase subunit type 1 TsaE [Candidatus Doudnabacteria bacterium CG10_big_fil_rev_8_21_14_0_10_41_10]
MKTIISNSPKETRLFAAIQAKKINGSTAILLNGELGSGKTEFVKGFCKAVGITKKISSPTFILQKSYDFKKQNKPFVLHHFDFYRLKGKTSVFGLGLKDIFEQKNQVTIIEWPKKNLRLYKLLPKKIVRINFQYGEKENSRKITIADSAGND